MAHKHTILNRQYRSIHDFLMISLFGQVNQTSQSVHIKHNLLLDSIQPLLA